MIRYSKLLRIIGDIKHLSRIQTSAVSFRNKQVLNEPDPFGLAEEDKVEELIQGIYVNPPKPKSSTTNDEGDLAVGLKTAEEVRIEQEEALYKQKYGNWLKSSDEKILAADKTVEAVRTLHFGQIRLDSENVATVDGQFDDAYKDDDGAPRMLAEYLRLKKMEELQAVEEEKTGITTKLGGEVKLSTDSLKADPILHEQKRKLDFAITKNCPEKSPEILQGKDKVPSTPDLQSYNIKPMKRGYKEAITKSKVLQSTQFGLAEEDKVEELIQRIYINPPKHNPSTTANDEGGPVVNLKAEEKISVEQEEAFYKQKNGHRLKSSDEKILAADKTVEAVHTPHRGQVRLDSVVNLKAGEKISVEQEEALYKQKLGHRLKDSAQKIVVADKTEVRPAEAVRTPRGQMRPDSEKDTVARKFDNLNKDDEVAPRTLADYLKLKKKKKLQAMVEEQTDVTTKLGGREFKVSKDSVRIDPIQHVPKIYEFPKYNEVTHEDMWVYLRKQICFENDFLIALNKPNGIAMHNSTAECRHKIEDFLPDFAQYAKVPEVFTCHRLDKDTSGVLIIAKSEQAAVTIKQKFVNRTMLKLYFAITKNCPQILEGTIKIPIGEGKVPNTEKETFRAVLKPDLQTYNIKTMQKGCKEAITKFKVLQSTQFAAFLEVRPETGITHQVRVHLAHGLGCPIIGDHKYSHRDKMAPQRLHEELLNKIKVKQSKVRLLPLHLHCSKMEFTMPDGFMSKPSHEPIFVHARPPKYFMNTLKLFNLSRN